MEEPQLRERLLRRNAAEVYAFKPLIESHTRAQATAKSLSARNTVLEREVAVLREENGGLRGALQKAQEGAHLAAETKLTNEKISQMQQELTMSYKKNAEVSEQLYALQTQLQVAQQSLKTTELACKELESKVALERERVVELSTTVDAERAARAAAADELEARAAEAEQATRRSAVLESENVQLVERLMQLKLAEAEKLNTANAMYEDVMRRANTVKRATVSTLLGAVGGHRAVNMRGMGSSEAAPETPKPKKVGHRWVANAGGCHAAAFDSSGSRLATVGVDKLVHVWEPSSGTHISTLRSALQTTVDVAFSPDDKLLLAGSSDHALRLWDVTSGRIRHTLTGHSDKVAALCFSLQDGSRAVSCGSDRCIKVWDLNKGYCVKSLMCASSCGSLCVTVDGNVIVSGHFDGTLRFWDVRKGDLMHEVEGLHSLQMTSVVLSPSGCQILTNSRDNTLKLLDMGTYQASHTYRSPGYRVGTSWSRACFSPDGKQIASGSSDGDVYLWKTEHDAAEASVLHGHKAPISCCSWSPKGLPLVSADSKTGECILWR